MPRTRTSVCVVCSPHWPPPCQAAAKALTGRGGRVSGGPKLISTDPVTDGTVLRSDSRLIKAWGGGLIHSPGEKFLLCFQRTNIGQRSWTFPRDHHASYTYNLLMKMTLMSNSASFHGWFGPFSGPSLYIFILHSTLHRVRSSRC